MSLRGQTSGMRDHARAARGRRWRRRACRARCTGSPASTRSLAGAARGGPQPGRGALRRAARSASGPTRSLLHYSPLRLLPPRRAAAAARDARRAARLARTGRHVRARARLPVAPRRPAGQALGRHPAGGAARGHARARAAVPDRPTSASSGCASRRWLPRTAAGARTRVLEPAAAEPRAEPGARCLIGLFGYAYEGRQRALVLDALAPAAPSRRRAAAARCSAHPGPTPRRRRRGSRRRASASVAHALVLQRPAPGPGALRRARPLRRAADPRRLARPHLAQGNARRLARLRPPGGRARRPATLVGAARAGARASSQPDRQRAGRRARRACSPTQSRGDALGARGREFHERAMAVARTAQRSSAG